MMKKNALLTGCGFVVLLLLLAGCTGGAISGASEYVPCCDFETAKNDGVCYFTEQSENIPDTEDAVWTGSSGFLMDDAHSGRYVTMWCNPTQGADMLGHPPMTCNISLEPKSAEEEGGFQGPLEFILLKIPPNLAFGAIKTDVPFSELPPTAIPGGGLITPVEIPIIQYDSKLVPICGELIDSECETDCSGQFCGNFNYDPRPEPASADADAGDQKGEYETGQKIELDKDQQEYIGRRANAMAASSEGYGLYKVSCDVKNITDAFLAFAGKGKATLNIFRFGVGSTFDDFDEAQLWYPLTDTACNLNKGGSVDRYTNYPIPNRYCDSGDKACFSGDGGQLCEKGFTIAEGEPVFGVPLGIILPVYTCTLNATIQYRSYSKCARECALLAYDYKPYTDPYNPYPTGEYGNPFSSYGPYQYGGPTTGSNVQTSYGMMNLGDSESGTQPVRNYVGPLPDSHPVDNIRTGYSTYLSAFGSGGKLSQGFGGEGWEVLFSNEALIHVGYPEYSNDDYSAYFTDKKPYIEHLSASNPLLEGFGKALTWDFHTQYNISEDEWVDVWHARERYQILKEEKDPHPAFAWMLKTHSVYAEQFWEGHIDEKGVYKPGAEYECTTSADCISGYCNNFDYARGGCVSSGGVSVPCGCRFDGERGYTVCDPMLALPIGETYKFDRLISISDRIYAWDRPQAGSADLPDYYNMEWSAPVLVRTIKEIGARTGTGGTPDQFDYTDPSTEEETTFYFATGNDGKMDGLDFPDDGGTYTVMPSRAYITPLPRNVEVEKPDIVAHAIVQISSMELKDMMFWDCSNGEEAGTVECDRLDSRLCGGTCGTAGNLFSDAYGALRDSSFGKACGMPSTFQDANAQWCSLEGDDVYAYMTTLKDAEDPETVDAKSYCQAYFRYQFEEGQVVYDAEGKTDVPLPEMFCYSSVTMNKDKDKGPVKICTGIVDNVLVLEPSGGDDWVDAGSEGVSDKRHYFGGEEGRYCALSVDEQDIEAQEFGFCESCGFLNLAVLGDEKGLEPIEYQLDIEERDPTYEFVTEWEDSHGWFRPPLWKYFGWIHDTGKDGSQVQQRYCPVARITSPGYYGGNVPIMWPNHAEALWEIGGKDYKNGNYFDEGGEGSGPVQCMMPDGTALQYTSQDVLDGPVERSYPDFIPDAYYLKRKVQSYLMRNIMPVIFATDEGLYNEFLLDRDTSEDVSVNDAYKATLYSIYLEWGKMVEGQSTSNLLYQIYKDRPYAFEGLASFSSVEGDDSPEKAYAVGGSYLATAMMDQGAGIIVTQVITEADFERENDEAAKAAEKEKEGEGNPWEGMPGPTWTVEPYTVEIKGDRLDAVHFWCPNCNTAIHFRGGTPEENQLLIEKIKARTPEEVWDKVDIISVDWKVDGESGLRATSCGEDLWESKMEKRLQEELDLGIWNLQERDRVPKPIMITEFGIDTGCYDTETIGNFLTYLAEHQNDLVKTGHMGLVYKDWNAGGESEVLSIRRADTSRAGFYEKSFFAARLFAGYTMRTYAAEAISQDECKCQPCTDFDDPAICNGRFNGKKSSGLCDGYGEPEIGAYAKWPSGCIRDDVCYDLPDFETCTVKCDINYPDGTVDEGKEFDASQIVENPELFKDVISSIGSPRVPCFPIEGEQTSMRTFLKFGENEYVPEPIIFNGAGDMSKVCNPSSLFGGAFCGFELPYSERVLQCKLTGCSIASDTTITGEDAAQWGEGAEQGIEIGGG